MKPFTEVVTITLIMLGIIVLQVHNATAASTALADLVATMSPGTWAQLSTNNINQTLSNTGGASGIIFGYTEYIKWDPVGRQRVPT